MNTYNVKRRQIIRVIMSEFHNRLNGKTLNGINNARSLLGFYEIKYITKIIIMSEMIHLIIHSKSDVISPCLFSNLNLVFVF